MKLGVCIAVAIVGVVAHAEPARACSADGRPRPPAQIAATAPDIFTWFERAEVVAEVEVTAAPGFTIEGHGLHGDVVLAVHTALKGKPAATITIVQELTPCGGMSKGMTYVGFFDAKGHALGETAAANEPALVAWRAARTPAEQHTLLATLAANKDPLIAGAAAKRIAAMAPPAWTEPANHWKRPGTAALAIARVRAQWPAVIADDKSGKLADFGEAMTSGRCTLEATKRSCTKERAQIIQVSGTPFLGDNEALAGDCWDVTCAVGFYTLNVYVGVTDGRVLAVWIPPEG